MPAADEPRVVTLELIPVFALAPLAVCHHHALERPLRCHPYVHGLIRADVFVVRSFPKWPDHPGSSKNCSRIAKSENAASVCKGAPMGNRITTITFAVVFLSLTSSLAEARDRNREETIRCESVGEKATYCPTNSIGKVELSRQLSRSRCEQYDTWGADRDGGGIWVRNGCRADFVVREQRGWGRGRGRDRDGDGDRDRGRRQEVSTLKCKSKDWAYEHCDVAGGARNARVVKQISETRCVKGDNWDTDRRGIWVHRGCAAEFEVR